MVKIADRFDPFYIAEQILIEERRKARLTLLDRFVSIFVFWLACLDLGTVAGLIVTTLV